MDNPKYDPVISVATPEPINDRFIGVSVNINIKRNATNNSKISAMEMMYFFITKFRFMCVKLWFSVNIYNSSPGVSEKEGVDDTGFRL